MFSRRDGNGSQTLGLKGEETRFVEKSEKKDMSLQNRKGRSGGEEKINISGPRKRIRADITGVFLSMGGGVLRDDNSTCGCIITHEKESWGFECKEKREQKGGIKEAKWEQEAKPRCWGIWDAEAAVMTRGQGRKG